MDHNPGVRSPGQPQQRPQQQFPGPPPPGLQQLRPPGPSGPYPPAYPGFRPPPGAPPFHPAGPWGFPPHPGFPQGPPPPFRPPPGAPPPGPQHAGLRPPAGFPGQPPHAGAPPPYGAAGPPPFPGAPSPFRGPSHGPGYPGFTGPGFPGPPGPRPGVPGPLPPPGLPGPPHGPPARPGPFAGPGPAAGPGPFAGPGPAGGPGPSAESGPAGGQGPAGAQGPAAAAGAAATGPGPGKAGGVAEARGDSPPPPLPPGDPAAEEEADEEERALAAEAAEIEAEAHKASSSSEADQKRLIARAWTAHKSAEGQVYYHNSITGDSSWSVPEGFAGDADTVGEAPVPVAQAQIGGSPWYEVKCSDGRRYFFNHSTHQTLWSMPPEVAAIKKQQADEAAKEAAKQRLAAAEQRAAALRQMEAAARAGGPANQPGRGQGPGGWGPPGAAGGRADAFRRMHMQQRMAARQNSGGPDMLSKEVRVTRFKQLLLEGGVNAFSLYAKVKAKLDKDERWKLLPSEGERRTVFDEFCKNVAAEQKELAAAAARQSVDGFKALLEEALQLERQLHIALLADKMNQQEEHQQQQQQKGEGQEKQEEGEQQQEKADADAAAADSLAIPGGAALPDPEDIPEQELDLSMEQLERYWSNDDRWGAVSTEQRGQMFKERFGAHAAAAAARKEVRAQQLAVQFRRLLQQLNVAASSSWRGSVRDAVRAAAAQHKAENGDAEAAASADGEQEVEPAAAAAALEEAEREQLFRQYVSELGKQEASERHKAQQQRQRQAAAEARLAEQAAESAARQRKAARSDAVSAYKTLLAEVVRDPEASFQTWLPKLTKDPLGRASNDLLSQDDLSFYFSEHTGALAQAAATAMAAALTGVMDQHLKPLLPEGYAASVASSSGPAAAALARQLPQPLQKFAAAEELLSGTLDDRWTRHTEQQRLDAWRGWIDEHVWGKPPAPPPSSSAAAAAGGDRAGPGSSRYPGRPPGRAPPDSSSSRPYEQQQQDGRGYNTSRGTGGYDMSRSNGAARQQREPEREREQDRGLERDYRDRERERDRGSRRDDRSSRGARYEDEREYDDRKRQRR